MRTSHRSAICNVGGSFFLLALLIASATSVPLLAYQATGPASKPEAAPPEKKTSEKPDADKPQSPKRTLDLANPRATMRTFLVAVQDALGDHPERIDDAVACLDTSDLKGEEKERTKLTRSLARRLYALIDKKGVKLDDIPDEVDEESYTWLELTPEEGAKGGQVELARDAASGLWRFTPVTLASIPALQKAVEKQVKEKPSEPAADIVPAVRRSPRATMGTFLTAMNADPPDWDQAVLCLDPTGRDREVWAVRGRELAIKLKNVMDKVEEVVLSSLPDDPAGEPFVWYASQTGNIVLARIETQVKEDKKEDWLFAPHSGEWRFNSQTLKTLDALYRGFEKKAIVPQLREAGVQEELTLVMRLQRWMPLWLRATFLNLAGWQWLVLAALLPLGWLIQLVTAAILGTLLGRWLKRRKIELAPEDQRRTVRSAGAVVAVLGWYYVIKHLGLSEAWLAVLLRGTKLAVGVATVWVGYRVVDIIGGRIAADKDVRLTQFDDVLMPLLRKILRLLVILIAVLIVLDWFGAKPTTVLGALGIGGVAIAFAAQDTLGNFFGSITVLFDRPFGIGDWIVIGDVEGTVERVGFRSTRVRTFYNSVITIPNSKMVNTQVDNYGARQYRRVRIMLSVTYATPAEKIDAFCEGVRELIRLHPYTRKDYYHVYFNQFSASSLDVLLYTFFEVPDWGTELRERHRLFTDILRLAQRLGVEFAFPTQTLWLQQSRESDGAHEPITIPLRDRDAEQVGMTEAARLYEKLYGGGGVHRPPVVIDTAPRSQSGGSSEAKPRSGND